MRNHFGNIVHHYCSAESRLVLAVSGGAMLMLGIAPAAAQDNAAQQPPPRQQLQHINTPQSIDQELARLTKDPELTPEQQQQVWTLLQERHGRIQSLFEKNPKASRQQLAPQIHAISDETHRKIHALLTDHQKELRKTGDLLRPRAISRRKQWQTFFVSWY